VFHHDRARFFGQQARENIHLRRLCGPTISQ
jgi:hypothetical protein